MEAGDNRNEFLFPRSYVGRAILYMFTVPFVTVVLYYIYSFICHAITGLHKWYCYCEGTLERPRELLYDSFTAKGIACLTSYIRHLAISIMNYIYFYLDIIFTIGVFSFIVWVCLRYTRNRAFDQKDWCKTFVYGNVLFLLLNIGIEVLAYFGGLRGNLFDFSYDISDMLHCIIRCVACCYLAYIFFMKVPFDCEPRWANEYSSKEFFSQNIKLFFKKAFATIRSKNGAKVILSILGLILVDVLYWFLKTI